MLHFHVSPGGALQGSIQVPGDKSISHRAVMLGAIAEGTTRITGFLQGEDCLRTLQALRSMGVTIDTSSSHELLVHGAGLYGLSKPEGPLYLGNSGTSMRLFSGLLSGQVFPTELTGDASLSRRPMRRVSEPLSLMHARISLSKEGTPPIIMQPATNLCGIDYIMPVASAQVKSSILLAGLYADGITCIEEPAITRDHTERMLESFGVHVERNRNRACVRGGQKLLATHLHMPADISSAAFFMVGASIADGSEILLERVGINPTRIGIITLLRQMGADIELLNESMAGAEPIADIRVRSARLHGIDIPESQVPLAIDEFPALLIAAACASGITRLTGAAELRVKESDRIETMAAGLASCGVRNQTTSDGITVYGDGITGGVVNSKGDHRIAMAFAMAGLASSGKIKIQGCDNVDTSFPCFESLAQEAGLGITARRYSE